MKPATVAGSTESMAEGMAPMALSGPNRLSEWPGAEAALLDLCRPFAPANFSPECVIVQPAEIPFPQDQLLVHHEHMTVVLRKHHGAPVEVHVMDEQLDGDIYTRKICLTPQGSNKVVEWGIVKLDFRYMAPEVRDEILAKRLPLGAVLIKYDVLRRVKPRWFVKLPADGPLLRLFGPGTDRHTAYGRIGTIYTNDEPAIEVLEIVVNCESPNAPRRPHGTPVM